MEKRFNSHNSHEDQKKSSQIVNLFMELVKKINKKAETQSNRYENGR